MATSFTSELTTLHELTGGSVVHMRGYLAPARKWAPESFTGPLASIRGYRARIHHGGASPNSAT